MLKSITRKTEDTAINIVNAVVGVCLALSPWLLGYADQATAAWNAWIVGAAIALIAVGALIALAEWEEWLNLALGIWAVIAAWVLGFSAVTAATWAHVIAGLIVAGLAAVELWLIEKRPVSTA